MRIFVYAVLLLIAGSCGTTKKTTLPASELNGNWKPIQEEIGGKSLPPVAFATQTLVLKDSTYTFTAESTDKGVAVYSNGKMDIYGKEGVNKGKHFTAIYKLEEGKLFICYNLKGDDYPVSFDTNGKPLYFLCVFRKGD